MFGIGVIGMTIFAATDAAMAWFVRYFLNGTFVARDPSALWIVRYRCDIFSARCRRLHV
jgi:hypothetical protein